MQPLDYLIEAKSFIEKGWCRRAFAMDTKGNHVSINNPNVVAYCVRGAIYKAVDYWVGISTQVNEQKYVKAEQCFDYLRRALGEDKLIRWNDDPNNTHQKVITAFNDAIELAKSDDRVQS